MRSRKAQTVQIMRTPELSSRLQNYLLGDPTSEQAVSTSEKRIL